jgi:hypothetical protein
MTEVDQGTGEGQPADDIRSALASAIAAQDEPVVDKAAEKPAPEAKEPDEQAKEGRVRRPDGTFAPKAEGEEPDAQAPEKSAVEKPEGESEPEKKSEVASKEPPANWPAAEKAMFKTMPEPVQQFLLKRHSAMEADYTKKTQAIASFKNEYEPVDKLFAPHIEQMKAKGFSPRTLIESWAKVETELAAGPDSATRIIQGLIKGYNIPVAKIAAALGVKSAPAAEPEIDPATGQRKLPVPEVQQQIQLPPELLERLGRVEQFATTEQQRRANEAQARQRDAENGVMSQIEKFKSASDDKGNLLHPHFEDVEADMTALANAHLSMKQSVPALDDLYERAVWANPSTREKVRTAETQAAEKDRAEKARAKAAAAKRASASVTGAPGAGQAPSGSKRGSELSLREQLLEAAEESADA